MKPDGPGQSGRLLTQIAEQLKSLDISYAVVGALAASFHGVVRSSLDADALLSASGKEGRIQTLMTQLRDCGLTVEHRRGGLGDPVHSVIAVTDRYQNCVDLLTGIRGMPSDFLTRTIPAPLLDTTLDMVGAEDFIAMKIFAGGPRDLEDAVGVIKVSGASLDYGLLEKLAAGFGPEVSRRLTELLER